MAKRKGIQSAEYTEASVSAPAPRRDVEILKVKGELAKQPKVSVYIPKDPLNPKEGTLYAAIGGNDYLIPKGKPVLVHRDLYFMLKNSGQLDG